MLINRQLFLLQNLQACWLVLNREDAEGYAVTSVKTAPHSNNESQL